MIATSAERTAAPSPGDGGGPMVSLEGVRFAYGDGGFALGIERLTIARGEHVACIGPSGTGKTTLVNLIAGIVVPSAGRVTLDGAVISALADDERRAARIATIGMVFQQFELLDYLSTLENVLLPYHVSSRLVLDDNVQRRALDLVEATGIGHALERRPAQLSQGERQRVALCRALVTQPRLVICDEPTGNLDPDTAGTTLDLLFEQVRRGGATLLMVTHDHGLLDRFDRTVDMRELAAP